MVNVIPLKTLACATPAQTDATHRLDAALVSAITRAREDGLLTGLIVAVLHAHLHQATEAMISGA